MQMDGDSPRAGQPAPADQPSPNGTPVGVVATTAAVVVAVCVLASLAWSAWGGSLYTMATASMCPNVCVGALVADRPVTGPIHVGELITFVPPGASTPYTHQVVAVSPRGIITKGAAEGSPDPWVLTRSEVTGQVAFTWWGAGWALRVLPFAAVAMALLMLIHPTLRPQSRRPFRMIWLTAMVAIPSVVLEPFIKGTLVQTTSPARGRWPTALVINTGLLPARFSVAGGQVRAHVPSTQATHVSGPGQKDGYLLVREVLSLYWWGWMLVVLLVASPLLAFVVHTWRMHRIEQGAVPVLADA